MQTQDQQSWIDVLSQSEGEQCLASIHSLSDQLRSAMDAIVQRSLSSLQHSLHLQQITCGRIADLRYRSTERLNCTTPSETVCLDSDLASEIMAARDSLVLLNNNYSALLKHSGETLRLLAGFNRSYRGFAQPASDTRATRPSWSCEI